MRVVACLRCNRRMQYLSRAGSSHVYHCAACNIDISTFDAPPGQHIAQISREATARYPLRIDQPAEQWTEEV